MTADNGMPLAEAQRIVQELSTPPKWMTDYTALPPHMRYLVDEFDDETTHALCDELAALLRVDTDRTDRINACHAIAREWSGHDIRVADWWTLVADWLDRPR